MYEHDASAETHQGDTFATHMRLLIEAAGLTDARDRDAFADVAHACWPRTVYGLVAALRRTRRMAPDRVGTYPVVAFIRHGRSEGMRPERGTVITAGGEGRYHVHTVFWDEPTARWEAQNGRYDLTWDAARDELNQRAEREVQP